MGWGWGWGMVMITPAQEWWKETGQEKGEEKENPRDLLLQRRSMTGSFNLNSVHSGPRKNKIWSPHCSIYSKTTTKLIWVIRPQTCSPFSDWKHMGRGTHRGKTSKYGKSSNSLPESTINTLLLIEFSRVKQKRNLIFRKLCLKKREIFLVNWSFSFEYIFKY